MIWTAIYHGKYCTHPTNGPHLATMPERRESLLTFTPGAAARQLERLGSMVPIPEAGVRFPYGLGDKELRLTLDEAVVCRGGVVVGRLPIDPARLTVVEGEAVFQPSGLLIRAVNKSHGRRYMYYTWQW